MSDYKDDIKINQYRLHEEIINQPVLYLKWSEKAAHAMANRLTLEKQKKVIRKYQIKNKVHEKGYRGKPLTEKQKERNKIKSKTRARVEHVFGFMEQSMNGLVVKSVGIVRAIGIIGLINLTYNLFRYEQVQRLNLCKV